MCLIFLSGQGGGKRDILIEQQHLQKFILPFGQFHGHPAPLCGSARQIHLHIPDTEGILLLIKSSQHHLHSGQQLFHGKRLHDIILCAAP